MYGVYIASVETKILKHTAPEICHLQADNFDVQGYNDDQDDI